MNVCEKRVGIAIYTLTFIDFTFKRKIAIWWNVENQVTGERKKGKKSVTTNFLSTKHNLSFNLSFLCFLGATCYVKSFAKIAKCVLRKSTYSFGNWSPINDIDFHFTSIFATISFDWLIDWLAKTMWNFLASCDCRTRKSTEICLKDWIFIFMHALT